MKNTAACSNPSRTLRNNPFKRISISAVIASLFITPTLFAEESLKRSGVFDEKVGIPSCGNAWTEIKHAVQSAYKATAGTIVSEVNDIAKASEELAVHGNPTGIADFATKNWSEAKKAASEAGSIYVKVNAITSKYALYQLVPDSKFRHFMDKVNNTVAEMQGSMPLQTMEGFEGDIKEISSDSWYVLSSINDPKEFAKRFAEMDQKWNPALTWTYLFTSGSIDEGIMRAAAAYNRQAEIIATYGGDAGVDPEIVEAAVMYGNMQTAKTFLDKLTDEKEKKAAQLIIIAFTGEAMRGTPNPAAHPFYKDVKVVEAPAKLLWNDHGSGGSHDLSIWGVDVYTEEYRSCISLGDTARNDYKHVKTKKVFCNALEGRGDWWERPTDYKLVWSDRCSGAHKAGSVWAPVCPEGYTNVGFVAQTNNGHTKPMPNRMACLKKDSSLLRFNTGRHAGFHWLYNDHGTGAKMNLEVIRHDFAGADLMWAFPTHGEHFLDDIMPMDWGRPGDAYSVTKSLKEFDDAKHKN